MIQGRSIKDILTFVITYKDKTAKLKSLHSSQKNLRKKNFSKSSPLGDWCLYFQALQSVPKTKNTSLCH